MYGHNNYKDVERVTAQYHTANMYQMYAKSLMFLAFGIAAVIAALSIA